MTLRQPPPSPICKTKQNKEGTYLEKQHPETPALYLHGTRALRSSPSCYGYATSFPRRRYSNGHSQVFQNLSGTGEAHMYKLHGSFIDQIISKGQLQGKIDESLKVLVRSTVVCARRRCVLDGWKSFTSGRVLGADACRNHKQGESVAQTLEAYFVNKQRSMSKIHEHVAFSARNWISVV
jgi:hypothetical protein